MGKPLDYSWRCDEADDNVILLVQLESESLTTFVDDVTLSSSSGESLEKVDLAESEKQACLLLETERDNADMVHGIGFR